MTEVHLNKINAISSPRSSRLELSTRTEFLKMDPRLAGEGDSSISILVLKIFQRNISILNSKNMKMEKF